MLSIIEQKCADDRKVWSRDLEREGNRATLKGLMEWMTLEMKSRMRVTAPLRTSSSSRLVNHFLRDSPDAIGKNKATWHKCDLIWENVH